MSRRLIRIAPPVNLTGAFSGQVSQQLLTAGESRPDGTNGFASSIKGASYERLPIGLRIGAGRGLNSRGQIASAASRARTTQIPPRSRTIRPRTTRRR